MRKLHFAALATLLMSTQAFAQEATTANTGSLLHIGLGLMLGLGAFGATTSQGRVGASAMEGLARNPQARSSMFVPMIIGLALIESLFILTWLMGLIKF